MGLRGIIINILQDLGSLQPLPRQTQSTAQTGDVMPTQTQANERAAQVAAQVAPDASPLEQVLRNTALGTKYDALLKVELPAGDLTKEQYDRELMRAGLRAGGLDNPTDGEIASLQYQFTRLSTQPFTIAATKEQLDALASGGELKVAMNERGRAIFQVAAEETNRIRNDRAERIDQARVEAQQYGTDAMKGWISIHTDSAVNVFNGVTEPLRGASNMAFGIEIPEAPGLRWHEQSEYWQKDGKGQFAETVGTLATGAMAGGAGLKTTAGQVIASGDAVYNIGTGAAGVDPSKNDPNTESGLREMTPLERTLRVTGGVVTAAGVSSELGAASRSASSTSAATVAEMVTPDGQTFRVRVPEGKTLEEVITEPMEVRVRNEKYAGGQYPMERLSPKLQAKYPEGVKFDVEGFPDFKQYAIKEVKIEMKGNHSSDFTAANKAAGLSKTPEGYTWHHHQDRMTMQLVPTDLHKAVGHSGGVAVIREKGVLK